jgi:uncharacterized protein YwqG
MTRDELAKLIRDSRISHLGDQIASRIRASIRLRTQPAELNDIPLGATRMGGVPDLPPGVDWPRNDETPLAFIAQVSLADVTELDRERVLPSNGWLCFFYDSANQPWGYDPAYKSGWRMLHFDAPADSLRRATPPAFGGGQTAFEPCEVTAEAEDTLPDTSALITEGVLEHMSDDFHAYFEFVDEYAGSDAGCRHRLLGNPDVIQGEMRRSCQFASNGLYCGDPSVYDDPRADVLARGAGEWILLLQVDSDEGGPGWMWGDCGRLYCWIRKQDLAQRDFDHVWVILQCF